MECISTDRKILSILNIGSDIRRTLDPEGILAKAQFRKFKYFTDTDGRRLFLLDVVFQSGYSVIFNGNYSDEKGPVIVSISYNEQDVGNQTVLLIVSDTITKAMGNLSKVPDIIKRNLVVPKNVNYERVFDYEATRKLCFDALFFGIDGGKKDDGHQNKFNSIELSFLSDDMYGNVRLNAVCSELYGRITIGCCVDTYGLSKKKVMLDYNFGMGKFMTSECVLFHQGKAIPSLTLAFDLLAKLDGIYSKQRKKKTGLGKPRSN